MTDYQQLVQVFKDSLLNNIRAVTHLEHFLKLQGDIIIRQEKQIKELRMENERLSIVNTETQEITPKTSAYITTEEHGSFNIVRTPESSNISIIGYDETAKSLMVVFKGNKEYHYYNVPILIWHQFLISESKGKYFSSYVKNGGFRYELKGEFKETTKCNNPEFSSK